MAYGNSISLAESYLPVLDGVYKAASKSAILDAGVGRVQFAGGNKVSIFKTSLDGLGDYSRTEGFATGAVTGTWENFTLSQDRARSLMVDSMDNEETLGQAYGTLVGEFMRVNVIPEIDAYRFAKYSGTSGISSANADITVGTTDVASLIDAAEQTMGDDEVPEAGRILFVSEKCYNALKNKITRKIDNGDPSISNVIEMYDGMPVIKVPKGRFNTKIALNDGVSAGETAGGYTIPTDGTSYPINFLIVHPSAVLQVVKHQIPRIFNPAENQAADAWKFDYRVYHDCFVEANKKKGIYLHRASTANS